jgi:hypothetical protein
VYPLARGVIFTSWQQQIRQKRKLHYAQLISTFYKKYWMPEKWLKLVKSNGCRYLNETMFCRTYRCMWIKIYSFRLSRMLLFFSFTQVIWSGTSYIVNLFGMPSISIWYIHFVGSLCHIQRALSSAQIDGKICFKIGIHFVSVMGYTLPISSRMKWLYLYVDTRIFFHCIAYRY